MKKSNRILAAVALSGAAFAVTATPAHALAGLGQTGGPFGAVAFALTDLVTGVPVSPPDPNSIIEKAKQQHAQEQAQQQH
ncbi:hypothetical protein GCM10010193_43290 [Kitasatospora atroaurantiaca]|uniref:Small secreted domain DUF320 n=1 Tax=Kitasatospora atroaurantiaca TaxID=285545 RepID=A0A561ETR0_9ACTN|nr:hypothetical protein [Kitasatospora atroaurantiaca]TWE19003.1 hypothetical protein FB465_4104 [Kitasatospora atroaurantiaca]